MAFLTQRTEVGRVTVLRRVVKVGNSQHHLDHLPGLFIPEVGVILLSAELTAVIGSLQYGCSYLFPVGRITALILWSYWHIISFLYHTTTLSVWYAHLR